LAALFFSLRMVLARAMPRRVWPSVWWLASCCVAFCNGCTQIRQSQATFVAKDGVRAYAKGDAAASLSHFDRALALDPHDAWALGNRAGLLMLRGQFDRALSDLDEALRLDPKQHHALINRCIALTHKAKLGQALDDCNAAVELSPANGYYRIMRASLLTEMSRNEEAERDIAEAMRIDPASGAALAACAPPLLDASSTSPCTCPSSPPACRPTGADRWRRSVCSPPTRASHPAG